MSLGKKIILLIFSLFLVLAPLTGSAEECFRCQVLAAGPGTQGTMILLTDLQEAFEGKWFITDSSISKETLATALTALSLSEPLFVCVDDMNVTLPLINRCFVVLDE